VSLLKTINVKEYELSRVQDNVADAFRRLPVENLILGGAFVTASLTTADASINHTLGREYQGWFVVDQDAEASVYRSSTSNLRPAHQIILKASASVNVRLYIF